jgi:hypothetical protein
MLQGCANQWFTARESTNLANAQEYRGASRNTMILKGLLQLGWNGNHPLAAKPLISLLGATSDFHSFFHRSIALTGIRWYPFRSALCA